MLRKVFESDAELAEQPAEFSDLQTPLFGKPAFVECLDRPQVFRGMSRVPFVVLNLQATVWNLPAVPALLSYIVDQPPPNNGFGEMKKRNAAVGAEPVDGLVERAKRHAEFVVVLRVDVPPAKTTRHFRHIRAEVRNKLIAQLSVSLADPGYDLFRRCVRRIGPSTLPSKKSLIKGEERQRAHPSLQYIRVERRDSGGDRRWKRATSIKRRPRSGAPSNARYPDSTPRIGGAPVFQFRPMLAHNGKPALQLFFLFRVADLLGDD